MLISLLSVKAVIIGGWFGLLFFGERLARADVPPASPARLIRNAGLWAVLVLLSAGLVAPLTVWGANHLIWARSPPMMTGTFGAGWLIIDLLILDCWTYWVHRTYHHVPVLWRLHEVHHRDEFLDTTSAVRFHGGEVLVSGILRLMPIAVLAIPLTTVILFEILLLCFALFHHSNLKLPPGFERGLSKLIVTPSIHWVHHHATWEDTNSNYAGCLSIWDRLFGSNSPNKRKQGMKIGIEGVEDQSFIALLLLPIRGSKK